MLPGRSNCRRSMRLRRAKAPRQTSRRDLFDPGCRSASEQPAADRRLRRPPRDRRPRCRRQDRARQAFTLHVQTNFVEVPFTVKDSKDRLVPGLTWRDVRVYENGLRQQMALFTVDPFPLSVALVIDQSMTYDNMTKVNNALGALQGAFAPYDEIAVFTYNNGPRMQTDFTAAQSARLGAVLERSKSTGREGAMAYTSGPLSQNINLNGGAQSYIDPNTNSTHGTSLSNTLNVPKEVHTLNDAILAAATHLSKTRPGTAARRLRHQRRQGVWQHGQLQRGCEVSPDQQDCRLWNAGRRLFPARGRLPGPHPSAADDARQHPEGLCGRDRRKP